jgi:hypothetical protein
MRHKFNWIIALLFIVFLPSCTDKNTPEQPDGETSILAIGFMSTVAHLLESEDDEYSPLNGVELVSKKVKALYVMAGKFGEDGNLSPGYNFGHNADALAFTRTVLNKWPKNIPIYISPSPQVTAVTKCCRRVRKRPS